MLVVTGGAIAFIGDRLGTKIGKKRLSIFGLRPRHTSNIITVITGFVITALTIGMLSATSKNVRTALFGMEELNANLKSTQRELDNVSNELNLARNEYQKASEDLQKSKDEVDDLQKEQSKLKEESDRLKIGNEKLELTNAKLIADNEKLSTENNNLVTNNERLVEDNKGLVENNEVLKKDNDKLVDDNKDLENRNENLRDGIVAIREGDIVFRAGEILASGVIQGNRDAESIVKDIDAMAEVATANISRRIGDNENNAVWIYQPKLHEIVQQISESNQPMVLRITAAGNLMRGEPVRTDLELYKNNKIYDKDEFILSKTYELTSNFNAEQVVSSFLNEVNRTAVVKGVLSDPITGAVGVMEASQLYQIVDEISKNKGTVILTAYAKEPTEAIGPLRLNIKVEKSRFFSYQ